MVIPITLGGCEKKSVAFVFPRVFTTTYYRGVVIARHGLTRPGMQGTISIGIEYTWEPPVQVEKAQVELLVDGRRSTYAGQYDTESHVLTISELPWVSGPMTDGRFERFTDGIAFVAVPSGFPTARAYCGTWRQTGPSDIDRGRLGIVVLGTEVFGVSLDDVGGAFGRLTGSYGRNGDATMTAAGHAFEGSTSLQAIFGSYHAVADDDTVGNWLVSSCPF